MYFLRRPFSCGVPAKRPGGECVFGVCVFTGTTGFIAGRRRRGTLAGHYSLVIVSLVTRLLTKEINSLTEGISVVVADAAICNSEVTDRRMP